MIAKKQTEYLRVIIFPFISTIIYSSNTILNINENYYM